MLTTPGLTKELGLVNYLDGFHYEDMEGLTDYTEFEFVLDMFGLAWIYVLYHLSHYLGEMRTVGTRYNDSMYQRCE
jgi:hypothetical protein